MDPSIAELKITRRPGQSDEELHAEQLADGVNSNAFLALLFAQHSGFAKGSEIGELVGATQQAVERAKRGGTEQADSLLTSQAIALNAVFLEMSRRAALNMGSHLRATETYMRLALKAQSQCRTTLETLAEIKNPRAVAFVKQANIAGGHQQVNNLAPESSGPVPEEAGRAGTKSRPNELLEEISDAQWLDPRAAPAAGAGNPELATVGAGDRPAKRRRKGQGG
ncbi:MULTISPECIES: hypothetical protein [Stenotrophomonas]|uniref:hypothetical protein n=1 Tax=Stenotrophomonas TaxID=40323 RepID=UPI0015DEB153|nr:hypothetical protein [Stenotrophomonas maltophilia]ELN2584891.1 hypothetical protein [Stenotrophomonas maltophilia]ELN2592906.1 hypothetical protein [Stenotrophomonas maltophilia]MBH1400401.1 hypothetical protein [Stenotrophomonas maltophilia]MBH1703071.1 hypothetical protein [Stenotrophomonas maltophilia]